MPGCGPSVHHARFLRLGPYAAQRHAPHCARSRFDSQRAVMAVNSDRITETWPAMRPMICMASCSL